MGEGGSLARSFNINGGARRKGVILLRFQTIETGIINLQATRLSSTQTRLMERAWPSPGGRSQHPALPGPHRPGLGCGSRAERSAPGREAPGGEDSVPPYAAVSGAGRGVIKGREQAPLRTFIPGQRFRTPTGNVFTQHRKFKRTDSC